MTPHRATLVSIERQGIHEHRPLALDYKCGCVFLTLQERWRLCAYHEGYDDAKEDGLK